MIRMSVDISSGNPNTSPTRCMISSKMWNEKVSMTSSLGCPMANPSRFTARLDSNNRLCPCTFLVWVPTSLSEDNWISTESTSTDTVPTKTQMVSLMKFLAVDCFAVRTRADACKESSSHALHLRVFRFQPIHTNFSSEANAIFVTTSRVRKLIPPTRIRRYHLPRRMTAAPGRPATRNDTDLPCWRWWTSETWRPLRNHKLENKSPCPFLVLGSQTISWEETC